MKTKAEITVLGPQSKKHQGLIAGRHQEVGKRRGVASPTEPAEGTTLPAPWFWTLSSLQNYQRIYLHCYKPPMLWKLQQPGGVNNTQGRWQAHCSAGSGQGVLWKNWKKPVQNQAGLLNVLLSRATAPPYGITLEIKRDSIDRECLVQLPQWRTFSLLMLKGTLPLTLKMNWREAAFGPVILVVWRYLRVQAFCLWLVRLSSRIFGYFPICFVG